MALIFLAIMIIITAVLFIRNYRPAKDKKEPETVSTEIKEKAPEQQSLNNQFKNNKNLVISTVIIQIVLITTIILILIYQ